MMFMPVINMARRKRTGIGGTQIPETIKPYPHKVLSDPTAGKPGLPVVGRNRLLNPFCKLSDPLFLQD